MGLEREIAATLPVHLTVGVTAHRNLLPAHEPAIRRELEALFDTLEREFPQTPLQVLCPLAEGGDRLFARVARERKIPLIVPLPLPRKYYLRDFPSAESREEFAELSRGATILELPLTPNISLAQVSRSGKARDREYAQLGVFVSSHSQILVALWDGQASGLVGGTDQIVRYRLYNVYPSPDQTRPVGPDIIGEDENDLTFHIRCSRASADDGSPPPKVTSIWLTGDPEQPTSSDLPIKHSTMFQATGKFNREVASRFARPSAWLMHAPTPPSQGPDLPGIRRLETMFRIADTLANHYGNRLHLALRGTYALAILMGGVFVGYSTLPAEPALLYVFLGLFGIGLVLYGAARRGEWHRKYLDYRGLAEGLRVQYFWAIAGVSWRGDGRFALESFLQKQDPELGWVRHVMRDVELEAGVPVGGQPVDMEFAVKHWIGNPEDPGGGGQVNYYRAKAREHYQLHRLTERLGMVCLWAGMSIAVFLAAMGSQLGPGTHRTLLLFLGLLPLVAAVRTAYSQKRADKELIKQYRFMERAFRNAYRRLAIATSPEEKREVLRVLGTAALDEHGEWILMHRERPLEQSKL